MAGLAAGFRREVASITTGGNETGTTQPLFTIGVDVGALAFLWDRVSLDPSLGFSWFTGGQKGTEVDVSGFTLMLRVGISLWFMGEDGPLDRRPAAEARVVVVKEPAKPAASVLALRERFAVGNWVVGIEGDAREQGGTLALTLSGAADAGDWEWCEFSLSDRANADEEPLVLRSHHAHIDGREHLSAYAEADEVLRWLDGETPQITVCKVSRDLPVDLHDGLQRNVDGFTRDPKRQRNARRATRAASEAGH